jgi:gliding motility associated protien GldN
MILKSITTMKQPCTIHLVLALLLTSSLNAQSTLDSENPPRIIIPYPYLRESDVLWSKKVWRHIDLNEKINAPLRYPLTGEIKDRKNFISLVMDAVKEGSLTAYKTDDDEFTWAMTKQEFEKVGGADTIYITVVNPEPPYDPIDTAVFRPFNPDDVVMLRLKEEWFFDKQRSVMDVRIIGICPVALARDQNGDLIEGGQKKPLFWIYFPELRSILIDEEVFNRFNTSQRLTYDDVFMKRMFNSYIMKEDNVYNRRIEDYRTNPLDALLESERIKQEMVNFEHDLWEY